MISPRRTRHLLRMPNLRKHPEATTGVEGLAKTAETVRYFHGTAADLPIGAMLEPGRGQRWDYTENLGWVYLTTEQDSARGWAFRGLLDDDERSRLPWIYEVQPTGPVEPDPLEQIGAGRHADFRSRHPLKIIAKVSAGGSLA